MQKEKEYLDNKRLKERGITLVSLVVTIIVLLILTGITVTGIIGKRGIIKTAKDAKAASEIKEEKEAIKMTAIAILSTNANENITYENLKKHIQNFAGIGKAKAVIDNGELYVKYIESQRCYKVEQNGKLEGPVGVDMAKDANPGDITTNSEGKALAGTETEPYEINCIEDLCGFSNSVNSGTSYTQKYIILTRDLDFNSDFSYVDGSISVSGDITSCNNIEELMDLLTNRDNSGFIPIGKDENNSRFQGNFDGQNYSIKNIYENTDQIAGLFGMVQGSGEENPTTIKNLTITGEIKSSTNAGGIVGTVWINHTNFETIKNYVNVLATGGKTGGIIGTVSGSCTVNNCSNYGTITTINTGGYVSTGGIIGYAAGSNLEILNSANYGIINGRDGYAYDGTGGIIGSSHVQNFYVNNSCNYAKVSGGDREGGIIGNYVSTDRIFNLTNVFNVAEILVSGWREAGGLVGAPYATKSDASTTLNSYYISTIKNGVGGWTIQVGTQYTEEQLKGEAFVNTLNSYIQSNTDGIDTTGWAKWVYNENEYPTLDTSTTWNGTAWE